MNSDNATTEWTAGIKDVFDPHTLHGALLVAVVVFTAAWFAGQMIFFAVHRILNRPKHILSDPTAIRFMGELARVGIYVIALIVYVWLIPALEKLAAPLLASVGVVSVVFGLAAQNTLGNLIAGISLLLYRPFSLGDRVQVTAPTGVETGIVENLNLGYTVLRTADERHVVIPNSVMASQTSINLSLNGSRALCVVPFVLGPDTDLERVRKILVEIAAKFAKPEDYVGSPVTAIAGSSTTITLRIRCPGSQAAIDLKSRLLEAARERFNAEGIKLQ